MPDVRGTVVNIFSHGPGDKQYGDFFGRLFIGEHLDRSGFPPGKSPNRTFPALFPALLQSPSRCGVGGGGEVGALFCPSTFSLKKKLPDSLCDPASARVQRRNGQRRATHPHLALTQMNQIAKFAGLFSTSTGSISWPTIGANATYLVAGTTGIGLVMSRVSKALRRNRTPPIELKRLFSDVSPHAKLAQTYSTPEAAALWFQDAFPHICTILIDHVLRHIDRIKVCRNGSADHKAMVEDVLEPIKSEVLPSLADLWRAAAGGTTGNMDRISAQAHRAICILGSKVQRIKNALRGKYDASGPYKNMRGGLDKGQARKAANEIETLEKKIYSAAEDGGLVMLKRGTHLHNLMSQVSVYRIRNAYRRARPPSDSVDRHM